MRSAIAFVFALFLLSANLGAEDSYYQPPEGLRKRTEKFKVFVNIWGMRQTVVNETVEFYDRKGNLLGSLEFKSGELVLVKDYEYDESGSLTKKLFHDMEIDSEETWTYKYKRDEKGRVTEKTEFEWSTNTLRKWLYEYNEHGKVTEELAYKEKKLVSKWLAKYNDEGVMTEAVVYKGDRPLQKQTYNDDGEMQEVVDYSADGAETKTTYTRKRNEKGWLLETFVRQGDKLLWRWVFKRRADGSLEDWIEYKDTELFGKWHYNDKGKITEITNYENGMLKRKLTYEHDEKGNITETNAYEYFNPGDGDIDHRVYQINYSYEFYEPTEMK